MTSELYELQVLVEADGWHEMAALLDAVDRALDPHQRTSTGGRRWSVTATRVPRQQAAELLTFIAQCDDVDEQRTSDRLSA